MSGAFAGLSGGLLAVLQESAYPDVMNVHGSGFIVMATLIGGGLVSFWGPVIGAVVFIVARDLLGSLTETWLLWYGLLFILVVLFQPEGVAGAWQRYSPKISVGQRPLRRNSPGRLPMALFEAHNLSKRFGDQVVLEDISLKFEKGQLSGIMGPNGAGKSTCFNVLTGHFPLIAGASSSTAKTSPDSRPRQIAQKGVARSFQIISLFDEFTALENVLLALPEVRSRGLQHRARCRERFERTVSRALAVIEQVGLRASADIRSASLSYGERRALEIAVALAAEPRILFLDEPTQGMGADGRNRLLELIGQLKRHSPS